MYYDDLIRILRDAENVVFFGGAGVSTASGIPDFRSASGLYNSGDNKFGLSPENILDVDFLYGHPREFYEFYRSSMIYPGAGPNEAHYALQELEEMGKLKAIITQNIDGLHQQAGSQEVYELHGSVAKNYCIKCGKKYSLTHVMDTESVPKCERCGGMVRPDVVMYGEALPSGEWYKAEEAIANADVLIVGGTSLTVHPAASLVNLFEGEHLIIINLSPTPYDGLAEMVIREPVDEVLRAVVDELKEY